MGFIYLVRHGQASFAAENYDQLSAIGEEQARRLGAWIAEHGLPVGGIAVGTQKRHRQSAEACTRACAAPIPENWLEEAGFDEFDYQEILVRYHSEFKDRSALKAVLSEAENPRRAFQRILTAAVQRWIDSEDDAEYGESWSAFRKRVVTALHRLIETAGTTKDVWVFTSGGPIMVILQNILALPDPEILQLNWTLVNTGVTKLIIRPGRISISYINAHAHLERLSRPELITW